MLEFTLIDENVIKLKEFFELTKLPFCDLTEGVRYMWKDEYLSSFAIFDDTLILKNGQKEFKDYFFYPIGKNIDGALEKIEEFAKTKGFLGFCVLDDKLTDKVIEKYPNAKVTTDRRWSDYIYNLEDLAFFKGKKYGGQRNHVNKFKKLYNYTTELITKENIEECKLFLNDYIDTLLEEIKKDEVKKTINYLENIFVLNHVGMIIKVEDKIVGLTIGEVSRNILFIHAEKALTSYQGVYPTLVSEFARLFVNKAQFINREEDCGDIGLRTSKTQYNPIEIKDKYFVYIDTLFSKCPDTIKTKRLTLKALNDSHKEDYCRLYTDDELNKFWGYDYREDLGDNLPTPDYFINFAYSLKKDKQEYSYAIMLEDKMIGEGLFWNFDFNCSVELGIRLFKEYQGHGYAVETYTALKETAKTVLGAKTVYAKCIKANLPSKKMILNSGFENFKEDDTYYYFKSKI
ncbi:MAG: GNAT family N-acetyltransferase [Clostridiales bacterium]|nr:GNAT family N-acetyltransferase [Clostridiales bacterium]